MKFFSAYDKNVVRDYPHKLHSYHTESEDFRRVALDFVEMDQSEKKKKKNDLEQKEADFQETGSGYNFSGSGPGVNGPVGIFEENHAITESPEFIIY